MKMKKQILIAVPAVLIVFALIHTVIRNRFDHHTADIMDHRIIRKLPPILKPDQVDEVQPLRGRGPAGERPASPLDVLALLNEKDFDKITSEGFRVVICMQDIANDWSRLQVQGIRAVLEPFNVEITAVTDGEFDLDKQLADYTNAIALNPDIIITIPLHTEKCAPVLRKAVEKNIRLVFIDTVPNGFSHPRDYAGMVIADSYTNGMVAAEIIAERLNGNGSVAMLHWRNKIFTCDERTRAARDTFSRYDNITVVTEEFFNGVYDVPGLTEKILNQHAGLDGLWVVWDTPAMEAVRVIRRMKKNVHVATVDLGYEVAKAIAAQDIVIGTGAQHPYDQGVAEALVTLAALAGKSTPAYVAVPGEKVTRQTLERAWRRVFHRHMPPEIKKLLDNSTRAEKTSRISNGS